MPGSALVHTAVVPDRREAALNGHRRRAAAALRGGRRRLPVRPTARTRLAQGRTSPLRRPDRAAAIALPEPLHPISRHH